MPGHKAFKGASVQRDSEACQKKACTFGGRAQENRCVGGGGGCPHCAVPPTHKLNMQSMVGNHTLLLRFRRRGVTTSARGNRAPTLPLPHPPFQAHTVPNRVSLAYRCVSRFSASNYPPLPMLPGSAQPEPSPSSS